MNQNTNTQIGIDFSINSPALTIFTQNTLQFAAFSRDDKIYSDNIYKTLYDLGVNISVLPERQSIKNINLTSRQDTIDSLLTASYIIDTIKKLGGNNLDPETNEIVIEGFSYSSPGNRVMQNAGYHYVLRNQLIISDLITIDKVNENFWTFVPLTIKKFALLHSKSKKSKNVNFKGKEPIIESFIDEHKNPDCLPGLVEHPFYKAFCNDPEFFKRKNKSFNKPIDDIIDSYYIIKTLNIIKNDLVEFEKYSTPNKPTKKRKKRKKQKLARKQRSHAQIIDEIK